MCGRGLERPLVPEHASHSQDRSAATRWLSVSIWRVTSVPAGPPSAAGCIKITILRGVVRRRDHNPVGKARPAPAVVIEDGVGHSGRRRVFIVGGELDVRPRWPPAPRGHFATPVRKAHACQMPRNNGPLMACASRYRQIASAIASTVPFVEPARERRTPVARGAEADSVRSNGWIGALGVVRRDQARDVDQAERIGRLPREGAHPCLRH